MTELPERYNVDMLQLMVRDAHSLYTYWEISDRRRWLTTQHLECDWHVLPKVIRVYDTTKIYFNGYNANEYFDVETTPEANNWYIHGLRPGTTYAADLGTYSIERQFIPLIRSNFVVTPRDAEPGAAEPIVSIIPGANKSRQPLQPAYLENFSALARAVRNGVYLNDEATNEEARTIEARRQGTTHPGFAYASALYPSS